MKSVAISGSASGIGAACADRLSDEGWRVIGIDLHDADIEADLGTAEGRARAVEAVAAHANGSLDGLVTCAGLGGWPSRSGALVASVNYFGTVALLDGLRPLLVAGDQAGAVAISSNSTTIQPGIPDEVTAACLAGDEQGARAAAEAAGAVATYPATKLAVAHWVRTRATRDEWAGAGVRLNAVAPGMIETALIAEGRADPEAAPMLDALPIPIGRPGQPEEVAALVAFLLGPDAGFFCGSVLFIDGGSDALLRATDYPAPWQLNLRDAFAEIRTSKTEP